MNMTSEPKKIWHVAFSWQEEGFLFSSLMLITCFFLPWHGDQTPAEILSGGQTNGDALPWYFLLICTCLTPLSVRLPRVRPWAGLWTANAVNGFAMMGHGTDYGAQLARLFALAMLVLSAAPAAIQATDLAMKQLNSQKAEVFSHSGTVLEGIQFSAQEFYAKLENEIRARQWPGVEILHVPYREAGLFSHKRDYLRVLRQRQVFDIGASTFGKDYFFTLREAEIKPQLTIVTFLIFLLILSMLFSWCLGTLGFFKAVTSFVVLGVVGFFLLFNVLRMGLTRIDSFLMLLPVIGPVYETWFRRSTTYFQHDSRMVFLKLMDDLVKRHLDEEVSAKGVQLLSCFEHQPILDGLYKTSVRTTKRAEEK